MKKVWILLLLLCISFSLFSCGNEKGNITNEDSTQQMDTDIDEKKWEPILVYLSVNPQFYLTLDENLMVTEIELLNDDAIKGFSSLEIVGEPLDLAMDLLLKTAHDKGYLKNGSQISVVCEKYNNEIEVLMIQEDIETSILNIEKIKNIEIETTYDPMVVLENNSNNQGTINNAIIGNSPNINESQFKTVEKNEKGWIVKTVQVNAEGRDITNTYTYNDKGFIIENSLTQYDALGKFISCTYTYNYDTNGNVVSKYGVYQDGSTEELTYQKGELITKTTFNASNGYNQVETYNNGVVVISKTTGPDGFYSDWYYDTKGNPIEHFGIAQSGAAVHTIYVSNGYSTTYTYIDGTVVTQIYDKNGNLVNSK